MSGIKKVGGGKPTNIKPLEKGKEKTIEDKKVYKKVYTDAQKRSHIKNTSLESRVKWSYLFGQQFGISKLQIC